MDWATTTTVYYPAWGGSNNQIRATVFNGGKLCAISGLATVNGKDVTLPNIYSTLKPKVNTYMACSGFFDSGTSTARHAGYAQINASNGDLQVHLNSACTYCAISGVYELA